MSLSGKTRNDLRFQNQEKFANESWYISSETQALSNLFKVANSFRYNQNFVPGIYVPSPLGIIIMLVNACFHFGPVTDSRALILAWGFAVLARGVAESQYSLLKTKTTGRGPVIGPMLKHPFHDIFINHSFFFFFFFQLLKCWKSIKPHRPVNTGKYWPSWIPRFLSPKSLWLSV